MGGQRQLPRARRREQRRAPAHAARYGGDGLPVRARPRRVPGHVGSVPDHGRVVAGLHGVVQDTGEVRRRPGEQRGHDAGVELQPTATGSDCSTARRASSWRKATRLLADLQHAEPLGLGEHGRGPGTARAAAAARPVTGRPRAARATVRVGGVSRCTRARTASTTVCGTASPGGDASVTKNGLPAVSGTAAGVDPGTPRPAPPRRRGESGGTRSRTTARPPSSPSTPCSGCIAPDLVGPVGQQQHRRQVVDAAADVTQQVERGARRPSARPRRPGRSARARRPAPRAGRGTPHRGRPPPARSPAAPARAAPRRAADPAGGASGGRRTRRRAPGPAAATRTKSAHQARLPDPGLAGDEQDRPGATGRALERGVEHPQFAVAFEQARRHRSIVSASAGLDGSPGAYAHAGPGHRGRRSPDCEDAADAAGRLGRAGRSVRRRRVRLRQGTGADVRPALPAAATPPRPAGGGPRRRRRGPPTSRCRLRDWATTSPSSTRPPAMLGKAAQRLAAEPEDVRGRVRLVEATGERRRGGDGRAAVRRGALPRRADVRRAARALARRGVPVRRARRRGVGDDAQCRDAGRPAGPGAPLGRRAGRVRRDRRGGGTRYRHPRRHRRGPVRPDAPPRRRSAGLVRRVAVRRLDGPAAGRDRRGRGRRRSSSGRA